MKSIKVFGLAFVAMIAFGAMATSALAAEALFSATGELPTTVSGTATTNQVFKDKAGTITCTVVKLANNKVTKEKEISFETTVEYSKCTSTIGMVLKEPIVADYLFDANGSVKVLKPILIDLSEIILFGECSLTITEQLLDNAATYVNDGAHLLVEGKAAKINTENSCLGKEEGTYEGNVLNSLANGGNLSWSAE